MDRKGSGITGREELGAAVDHIEAALQIAFAGEEGARRLALAAGEARPVPWSSLGSDGLQVRDHLTAAIAELDRLRIRARRSGVPMEAWLEAVADDLKEAAPVLDIVALEALLSLTRRMAAEPARTLQAQAHIPHGAVWALTS